MPDYLVTLLPVASALLGVWLGQHKQGTREHKHWLREKRLELYLDALTTLHHKSLIRINGKSDPHTMLDPLTRLLDPELSLHLRMETLSDRQVRNSWDHTIKAAVALWEALDRQGDNKIIPSKEVQHFTFWREQTANAIRSSLT